MTRDGEIIRIAKQAFRDIISCDYRVNEPPEQRIARLALAEIDREERTLYTDRDAAGRPVRF